MINFISVAFYLITLAVFLLVLYIIVLCNKISVKRKKIQNTISTLDTFLIQRANLVPNLILILKRHVVLDGEIIQDILSLRNPTNSSNSKASYLQPEEGSSVLKQIILQIEDDSELKFNRQFSQLKYAFTECEEKISAERALLGASIIKYNNSVVTFPGKIIARVFGFTPYT